MSRKSKEEVEAAFQEKLRKEWGRDDIFVTNNKRRVRESEVN